MVPGGLVLINRHVAIQVKNRDKIKLEQQLVPQEQEEQQKLYARISEAVLAVPQNPAHGIHFDGLMELPTASIFGHRDLSLIPAVFVLNRGDLGSPKEEVQPALPAVLSEGMVLDDGSWVCYRLSGTEPVVRVYSEAPTAQALEKLSKAAKQWIFE